MPSPRGASREKLGEPFAALAVWFAGAGPVAAASDHPPPLAPSNLLQVTLGLVAVLVTIVVAAWLLRRAFRTHAGFGGHIRVLSGLSMGPREKLVLVQVGQRQLLLGVAPGRIQTLHVLEEPLPEAADPPAMPSFASHLARAVGGGRAAASRVPAADGPAAGGATLGGTRP